MYSDYIPLYERYTNELKPLVCEIEGRDKLFPETLLVDIALMFDFIASAENDEEEEQVRKTYLKQADEQMSLCISRANQHMIRFIQCKIEEFESRTTHQFRTFLEGGEFIGQYNQLKQKAADELAKCDNSVESLYEVRDLPHYQRAYEALKEVLEMILEHEEGMIMCEENKKPCWHKVLRIVISIIAGVLCGLICV